MKSFGSILAFTRQRNLALMREYRRHIHAASQINLAEISRLVVNSPSPRFWVSEERAAAVVSAMMRGLPVLKPMRPTKREMFIEIHRRVIALKHQHPEWPLCLLASEVVNSPAPKFYMEPSSAMQRIFKIRNGWYDRKHK